MEVNRIYDDHRVIRFTCSKHVCVKNGRMRMVRCKIYSIIERRDKLLVPKLDYLVKHLGSKKCIVAKNGIVVGEYFTCPTIQHMKNERLYGSIGQNTIATQVAN